MSGKRLATPVEAGPEPKRCLELEPAVAVRHCHEQLAVGIETLVYEIEHRVQLRIVEVLEDLRGDDGVHRTWKLAEIARLERLRIDARACSSTRRP